MKRLLLIAVAVLAGFSIMTLLPERETYEPATDLREAMQERMTDMLRIHAALEDGRTPEPKPR